MYITHGKTPKDKYPIHISRVWEYEANAILYFSTGLNSNLYSVNIADIIHKASNMGSQSYNSLFTNPYYLKPIKYTLPNDETILDFQVSDLFISILTSTLNIRICHWNKDIIEIVGSFGKQYGYGINNKPRHDPHTG